MASCPDATQIFPGLWLGSLRSAKNQGNYFTHVITALTYEDISQRNLDMPAHVAWTIVPIEDALETSIFPYFEDTINTIGIALNGGGKVLVHCMGGISRSPSLVAAYIMWRLRLGYVAAIDYVRTRRPCISPNSRFVEDLRRFEVCLTKNETLPTVPNKNR